jgi:hypothetical protein
MCGAIHPLLQYAFMAWCLVKHRDNFTFTFACSENVKQKSFWGRIIAARHMETMKEFYGKWVGSGRVRGK